MTNAQLEEILRESRRFAIPAVENNIFSIGGRGHYENPISDLLAFFLNTHGVHGFGDLVLRSINEAAGLPTNDTDLIAPPQREAITDDRKKIDILVTGNRYVTIIENKIRHWAANPFDSYVAYLNQYYEGKTKYLLLLSVRKESPPFGWISLTYQTLLLHLRKNLGEYVLKSPYSKWLILFREFLLNIEQECEPDPMTSDRFDFVCKNYSGIRELKEMADGYIAELKKKSSDEIRKATATDESDVSAGKPEDWGKEGIALRLYLKQQWGDESNITLLVTPTGSFQILFYVYDIPDSDVSTLREAVYSAKYQYSTEKSTIRCFRSSDISESEAVFQEIREVAQKLTAYYLKLKRSGI